MQKTFCISRWTQSTKHHSSTLQTSQQYLCFFVFYTKFCITKIVKQDFFGIVIMEKISHFAISICLIRTLCLNGPPRVVQMAFLVCSWWLLWEKENCQTQFQNSQKVLKETFFGSRQFLMKIKFKNSTEDWVFTNV